MIIVGTPRRGTLKVFKNPADAEAPYRAELRLPDGRRYQGRLRSHLRVQGGFWYEGFVTAEHAAVYAQDQQLVRYPAMPALAPARWDLLPCQIKINPYPSTRAHDASPELIGMVWVSRADGTAGGALFSNRNDIRLERNGADEVNRRNILQGARRHLGDWLHKPLAAITMEMVKERHDLIAYEHDHRSAARHLFKELTSAWNFARAINRALPECPVPHRGLYAKTSKATPSKALNGDEWLRFWTVAARHPDPLKGLSHWWQLLSGTRPVNTADLRWEWCDLDAKKVAYPARAMKNGAPFDLPLSFPMIAILERARELWDGPLVFYRTEIKPGHKRWRETHGDLAGLVGHRLRHSHHNVAMALGLPQPVVSMLHAHTVGGMAAVYTSTLFQFPILLEAQEKVTAAIMRLCGIAEGQLTIPPGAKVK